MSDMNKLDIEQLLSDYVDGQLPERERTEVKRLVLHNDALADQLRRMERQKQILNSLPVAAAPDSLAGDVKASLERKLILDEYTHAIDESAGVRHLLVRRCLSVAAMLILPIGVLGWVIFNIITPAPSTEKQIAVNISRSDIEAEYDKVAEDRIVAAEKAIVKTVAEEFLFDSTLHLASTQSIDINNFIKKAVYENDLIDCTIPKRPASQIGKTEYHINCDVAGIMALLDDLDAVWDKCDSLSLSVAPDSTPAAIVIDDVTHAQVMTIFAPTGSLDERIEKAKYFASANTTDAIAAAAPSEAMLAKAKLNDNERPSSPALSVPVEPIRTSADQLAPKTTWRKTGQTATLVIIVQDL